MNKELGLARRGGGLRLAIKVFKAIDKAGKQAARDAERRQKVTARELAKAEREQQKLLRELERDEIRAEKDRANRAKQAEKAALDIAKYNANRDKQTEKWNAARVKQRFQDSLDYSQEEYAKRCSERAALRKQFINAVLR